MKKSFILATFATSLMFASISYADNTNVEHQHPDGQSSSHDKGGKHHKHKGGKFCKENPEKCQALKEEAKKTCESASDKKACMKDFKEKKKSEMMGKMHQNNMDANK